MSEPSKQPKPYSTPQDVAHAALRLLNLSTSLPAVDLEMAAAILAVQVCDWHAVRVLGQPDVTPPFKLMFAAKYPDWEILRGIANGAKHPKAKYPDISKGKMRPVEWEDRDFWFARQDGDTLFVEVKGEQRSVHSLTFSFCHRYLEDNP